REYVFVANGSRGLREDFLGLRKDALFADGGAGQGSVLAQKISLLVGEGFGDDDPDADDEVSPAAPPEAPETASVEADLRAGLRAASDREPLLALEGRSGDLPAQDQRREREVKAQDDVVPLPLEDLVFADGQHDVEVSGRAAGRPRVALRLDPQTRPALDPGRNADRDLAGAALAPLAAAIPAGLLDDASRSPAGRAGPGHHQDALRDPLPAASSAGRAGLRPRPRLGSRPRAGLARDQPRDLQRRLDSDRGVLERHLHPVDDVAAGRAAGPAASEAGETEEVLEEVGELAEDRRVESGKARPAARDAGVPEPVVAGPLLGVGEDGVRLGGFLELLGRLGIAGIAVRVVRQGELAVRRLQLAVDGFPAYTEDLVV